MIKFYSIFCQLLNLFSRYDFQKAVKQCSRGRQSRGISSWEQFVNIIAVHLRNHSMKELPMRLSYCFPTLLFVFLTLLIFGCKDEAKIQEQKEVASNITQRSIRYRDSFYSVWAVDSKNVWVAGYWGTILHTSDGGKRWEIQETKTHQALNCIKFVDLNNGWAVGDYGTILNTNDGGKTWNVQKSNTDKNLLGVNFIDLEKGWAVGSGGIIIRTINSGEKWEQYTTELISDQVLNDIHFIGDSGWIVGEWGTILHTTDAGINWRKERLGKENEEELYFFAVDFLDSDTGWLSNLEGKLFFTDDGGKNWTELLTGTRKDLYDVNFENDGFGVGVGLEGTIMKTNDYGKNWTEIKEPKLYDWLRDVYFSDQLNGWIVGANGTILRTIDRGNSWTLVNP